LIIHKFLLKYRAWMTILFELLQSSFAQGVVTVLNACVMIFVIIAGSYIGFQIGWVGYKVSDG
jgi:uncharacterized membrane protein